MSSIKSFCQYYCAIITFISFFFFGIMILMERQQSEYLLKEFQDGSGSGERIFSLTVVIFINFCLFLVFLSMIRKSKEEELQED